MTEDETHTEYDGLYDGVEEYFEELVNRTDAILDELVHFEHRLNEIIYNKGWETAPNNHGMMLDAEEVPDRNNDLFLQLNNIIGDLVNLQKDL